jgi:hypothetical protein
MAKVEDTGAVMAQFQAFFNLLTIAMKVSPMMPKIDDSLVVFFVLVSPSISFR